MTVSVPRTPLVVYEAGWERERKSQFIQAHKRLTKEAEAIIANGRLADTPRRRVRWAA